MYLEFSSKVIWERLRLLKKLTISKGAETKLRSYVHRADRTLLPVLPQYTIKDTHSANSFIESISIITEFSFELKGAITKCCFYLYKTGMPSKVMSTQQIYLSHQMPGKWWGAFLSDQLGTEVEYSVSIMNGTLLGGCKIF